MNRGEGLSRGTTQSGVRLYNERLALSLIRRHGTLPKADIARQTGLSAQTVSVIVRQLERDGLVIKRKPQRGKVGQPLVPFALNPDGGFSIGLKLGRRSGDLMLIDLTGRIRKTIRQSYPFPTPENFLAFARDGLARITADLTPEQRERVAGLGLAAPFELWNWEEEAGAPHNVLEAWRGFDLTGAIAALCPWPVIPCNDATAACAAELFSGRHHATPDFAYFYLGYFIGGGIVLNGSLFQGRGGNAGALGSMPVTGSDGKPQQLIRSASFYVLEKAMAKTGLDPDLLWRDQDDWSVAGDCLEAWIERAAAGIAEASAAIASVIECGAVIIDGAMPAPVRQRLTEAVIAALGTINCSGISRFAVKAGAIGRDARALGAASLPLFANYIIDRDVLFKEVV